MKRTNKYLSEKNISITEEPFLLGKHNESAVNMLYSFVEQKNGGIFTIFSKGEAGKSHLVKAVGDKLRDNVPVNYSTTEAFASRVLMSSKENGKVRTTFEKMYCQEKMNYIILEDIQFAFDKDCIRKGLIQWLKYCIEEGKKVILTFRGNIEEVDPELKELLQSQLIVEIGAPDQSFKERVVRALASVNDVDLTEDEIFDLTQRESLREIKCMIMTRSRTPSNYLG